MGSGEGLPAGEGVPRDSSSESESSSSGDLAPLAKSIESTVSLAVLGALSWGVAITGDQCLPGWHEVDRVSQC